MAPKNNIPHTRDRPDASLSQIHNTASHPAPPQIDFDKYIEEMEDFDLTEDEARELLEALCKILVGIVDLTLGITPSQTVCGQNQKKPLPSPLPHDKMVKLKNNTVRLEQAQHGIAFPAEGSPP